MNAPKFRLPLALAALATLGLSSCFDKEKKNDPTPQTEPGCGTTVVDVTSNITVPTTWERCKVYVVDNVYIKSTLTIEAGTVVKIKAGGSLQLADNGRIEARGTAEQNIVFTSFRDDAHGGDSNGDGTASAPARRNWDAIFIDGTTGSSFEYCQFLYGGSGGNTLDLFSGTARVLHSTFAHNGDNPSVLERAALDASYARAGTVIQHNAFFDNARPLSISASLDLDDTNTFHDPAAPAVRNAFQGITVYWDTNHQKPNVSWAETELAYVLPYNIDLATGKTLTLADNVTVKFLPGHSIILRNGPGQLLNHAGAGVAFTSYKDDTRGGDSNGNGAGNAPSPGDWEGVYHDDPNGGWLSWSSAYFASH